MLLNRLPLRDAGGFVDAGCFYRDQAIESITVNLELLGSNTSFLHMYISLC